MGLIPSRRVEDRQYLKVGRLADVLALLQVLALDPYSHRSEDGLQSELQGPPKSEIDWTSVAKEHPEFFRVKVKQEGGSSISLIARHVLPKTEQGTRELSPEFVGQLITSAVDLHDRQLKRNERWTYLVPIWVALLAGIFTLGTALVTLWSPHTAVRGSTDCDQTIRTPTK